METFSKLIGPFAHFQAVVLIFLISAAFVYLLIRYIKTSRQVNIFKKLAEEINCTGLISINQYGQFTYWSSQAIRFIGKTMTAQDFRHWPQEYGVFQSSSDEHPVPYEELPILKALQGEKVCEQELFICNDKCPEGRYLSCSAYPIKEGKKIIGATLIMRDVTKNKELKRQLQKSIYNERMATMGKVAGGLAHEINTPLCTALLCLDSIKRNLESGDYDKISGHVQLSMRAIEKVSCITKTLKKYAHFKTEEDDFQEVDLSEMVEDAINICELDLRTKGINIELIKDPEQDYTYWTQATLFSQVIINLITNARDAISMQKERWIQIELDKNESGIIIQVTDSGTGIPVDIRTKMFTPFFTTKRRGEGSGLGMGIVLENLQVIRGQIKYRLKNGNTSFTVTLPSQQRDNITFLDQEQLQQVGQ